MKKTVIGIRGRGNTGKSQTIKMTHQVLKDQLDIEKETINNSNGDITIILEVDGIKIGIESQGDPNSRLGESLKLFFEKECEIIICATRTSGQTVDIVKRLRPQYSIVWFCQDDFDDPKDQKVGNHEMAQRILREVKILLNV